MHGAVTLSRYPSDQVRVACRSCSRAGRYQRATLITRFGADARLPDVLRDLAADCPRWRDFSDPCGAHYPDLRPSDKAPPLHG